MYTYPSLLSLPPTSFPFYPSKPSQGTELNSHWQQHYTAVSQLATLHRRADMSMPLSLLPTLSFPIVLRVPSLHRCLYSCPATGSPLPSPRCHTDAQYTLVAFPFLTYFTLCDRIWYIYTMEYNSAIKENETGSFTVMWMSRSVVGQWSALFDLQFYDY